MTKSNDKAAVRSSVVVSGGKVKLLTLDDLDRRTKACQHALDLRAGFLSDLGGEDFASVAQHELAQRASILGAMIEDLEAKWVRGDSIDMAMYSTLVNNQRRILNDIGLERRTRDVTPSLHEYLAQVRATEATESEEAT